MSKVIRPTPANLCHPIPEEEKKKHDIRCTWFHFQNNETHLKKFWMPDSVSKECYDCGEKFTAFRRKHHCRVCGQIFCSQCCNREVPGKIIRCSGIVLIIPNCEWYWTIDLEPRKIFLRRTDMLFCEKNWIWSNFELRYNDSRVHKWVEKP